MSIYASRLRALTLGCLLGALAATGVAEPKNLSSSRAPKLSPADLQKVMKYRATLGKNKQAAHLPGGPAIDPPNGMTTTPANAATLAQTLVGAGVTITGTPTLQGASGQAGTFTGGPSLVGFSTGIILSSGEISSAASTWVGSNSPSTSEGQPGNAQLTALIGGTPTFDAAVLSFSFIPTQSPIFFSYTFASAEYPNYIGQFNDPMGLFVNGTNVAVVPGTSTPVTINNVNAGANSSFFNKYNVAGDNLVYGGETKVLTATANVNVGVPNTIVLGVADASDSVLDSAVFIQAGSLSTTPTAPPVSNAPIPSSVLLAMVGLAIAGGVFVFVNRHSNA